MSDKGNKNNTGHSRSTQMKVGKSVEPPAKRTISEVSDTSAEELTVIHQQLESLRGDLKETKETVMKLMSQEEAQEFITKTIEEATNRTVATLEKLIDMKIKGRTQEMEEKLRSLEFENNNLKDRVVKAETELVSYKARLSQCEMLTRASTQKSNYNEQYSRKNNVKILNIKETLGETETVLTEKVVTELLSKGNVDLDPSDITAIHRIQGKPGQPKPVLLKLKNNSVKTKVMKQRAAMKAAGHRLIDNVTKLNTGLIGRLMKHAQIESAWYFNGAVYGKAIDGKRYKFDIYCSIDSVLNKRRGEDDLGDEDAVEAMVLEP